ncbi:MAG: helix-turn-helix domain-containing protein [Rickettsiales endosymbiont of Dermacentor nuttalli]
MEQTNFLINFEQLLDNKGIDIDEFCTLSCINYYELENVIYNRIISTSNIVIQKICNILECTVEDLFATPVSSNHSDEHELDNNNYKKLSNFNNINLELFFETIAKVDAIIDSEGKKISSHDKAKAYIAFYELADKLIGNA